MTSQLNLEVSILQFLYEYLKKASLSQLTHTRSSLIALIKEGLQLNLPPALFLLLVILHSCVQRFPLHEDRKMRKELQVCSVGAVLMSKPFLCKLLGSLGPSKSWIALELGKNCPCPGMSLNLSRGS